MYKLFKCGVLRNAQLQPLIYLFLKQKRKSRNALITGVRNPPVGKRKNKVNYHVKIRITGNALSHLFLENTCN